MSHPHPCDLRCGWEAHERPGASVGVRLLLTGLGRRECQGVRTLNQNPTFYVVGKVSVGNWEAKIYSIFLLALTYTFVGEKKMEFHAKYPHRMI